MPRHAGAEDAMKICDHCGRMIGSSTSALEGPGWATVGTLVLCHPTPNAGRPNCLRLVRDFGHQPDCSTCRMAGMVATR